MRFYFERFFSFVVGLENPNFDLISCCFSGQTNPLGTLRLFFLIHLWRVRKLMPNSWAI